MATVCAFESNTVTYFLTKDQTDASRSTTWHHTCLQVTGFPLLQSLSQRLVNLHSMGCALSRLRNSKRAKCYQVDDRQHNDDRVAEQQVGNMLLLLVSRCCMLLPQQGPLPTPCSSYWRVQSLQEPQYNITATSADPGAPCPTHEHSTAAKRAHHEPASVEKPAVPQAVQQKTKLDPKDYMFTGLRSETGVKLPG